MHFTYWDRAILTNPFQDHPNPCRKSWVIRFPLTMPLCSPQPYPFLLLCLVHWCHSFLNFPNLSGRQVRICSQFFFTHVSCPFSDSFSFLQIFSLLLILLFRFLQIPPSSPLSEPLQCLQFASHNLKLITVSLSDSSLVSPTRSYFTRRQGSSLFTPLIIFKLPNADQIVCCWKA